jgi:hypothetical protein
MQKKHLIKGKIVIFTALILTIICISGLGCASSEKAPSGVLLIEGNAVKDKAAFTLDELKSMEDGLVEADYFSINSYGTKGYTHFKGIWVWHLLSKQVNLKEDASNVTFIAEDGYKVEYTLEDIMKEDYIDEQTPETKYKMILAWEENGYELEPKTGMPLQLVVGQREPGDVNKPYWVKNVITIRVD